VVDSKVIITKQPVFVCAPNNTLLDFLACPMGLELLVVFPIDCGLEVLQLIKKCFELNIKTVKEFV
jgi:hypothetical protein